MNTLSHGAVSFPFTTVEELLQTPLVQRYAAATHLAIGKSTLWAYEGHALCLIGRLREPVRLPPQVSLKQDQ